LLLSKKTLWKRRAASLPERVESGNPNGVLVDDHGSISCDDLAEIMLLKVGLMQALKKLKENGIYLPNGKVIKYDKINNRDD